MLTHNTFKQKEGVKTDTILHKMKRNKLTITLCSLLMVALISSCKMEGDGPLTFTDLETGYTTVEIDGCEYLVKHSYHVGYLAHKGNCKYCITRQNHSNLEQ